MFMANKTSVKKDKETLSYALNKSYDNNPPNPLLLAIPSIVLMTFKADEQILAPGTEQL